MKTGSIRFFPMFSVASLLLILFCTSLSRAALPETKTNTTTYDETIAEYIEGEEEVFLGRSEISQRILAGYPPKYISYRGLEKPPACNANIYGNCIKSIDGSCTCTLRVQLCLLGCVPPLLRYMQSGSIKTKLFLRTLIGKRLGYWIIFRKFHSYGWGRSLISYFSTWISSPASVLS
ncbi:hypothetical protein REPUB_Repub12eG0037100 [Reevesia pubescens]